MLRWIPLAAALALASQGCATANSKSISNSYTPNQPAISEIHVKVGDDGHQRRFLLGYDFVLLNIAVNNPQGTPVSGEIACQPQGGQNPLPIRHRFTVGAHKRQSFMVPVDEAQQRAYTVRCRLQFSDDHITGGLTPSPWVNAKVPAKGNV